jgi:hydrogenase nickel incorporation protein HypA/HybF
MHELSLSSAILKTVLRHAGGHRVEVVNLRVGRLRQVVPDSLSFYFDIVSRGTQCEGARLEQHLIPARVRCGGCGHGWEPELPQFRCPACGGRSTSVLSGEEFEVDTIVLDGAEA